MKLGNLYLDIRPGDTVQIGKEVHLEVVMVSGNRLRLRIAAPVEVPVDFIKRPRKAHGTAL